MSADGLPINTHTAQVAGLDYAIIEGLEEKFSQAFDAGIINETHLRVALQAQHEILRGGPVMAYLALLRDEAIEQMAGLADINPNDPVAVIRAQQAISRFKHLLEWLKGAIAQKPQMPSSESPPDDA